MRRAIGIVFGGILGLAGLGFVCVQREAPRLERNLPDLSPLSVAGGDAESVETLAAKPDGAAVEPRAAVSSHGQAEECQRKLDALLANETIHFEVLSAAIRSSSQGLLADLALALMDCPDSRIEIAGHTDGNGIEDLNLKLSEARAESVRNLLIQMGIEAQRLVAVGYGSTQPVADDRSEAGRQKNRRIEFKVQGRHT